MKKHILKADVLVYACAFECIVMCNIVFFLCCILFILYVKVSAVENIERMSLRNKRKKVTYFVGNKSLKKIT